jgi:putative addiction module component (TIGR02574 family)
MDNQFAMGAIIASMDAIPPQLLQTVLALSESARADLAAELIASLDPETDEDYETSWEAEIGRRLKLHDSGATQSVPWPEARARIVGE